ncbi:MAG: nucleotidyltransferase family protein [Candidatus Dormibacteria bacterium]
MHHAAVFGSVARGDAIASSDIDVLVELDPAAHVSLFELMGIELRLADIFGRKVDVVSKGGASAQTGRFDPRRCRERVLSDAKPQLAPTRRRSVRRAREEYCPRSPP